VFARRTDGSLWRQSWDGSGWTGWSSLGGQWITSPAAVARGGASGVDVFEVGPGKDLQYAAVP
jgi:hypothetical protein